MSAFIDAFIGELDDQALARLAARLAPYLDTPDASASPLMTPDEAAVVLRCQRKRVYELVQRGALPARRDGVRILIARADLDAYLKDQA